MLALPLASCASQAPVPPVPHVDVHRYMGPWYVIASIPTRFERNAYNAIESYALLPDGRVQTTFRYRDSAFDAPVKTMQPIGTVTPDSGNAVWGMQFIWPFKMDYRTVIVARSKRDYVWIMARSPSLPTAEYDRLVQRVTALGYDASKLRKVPQRWPEAAQP
jgi:apolipoprotein D and lipocalin family protein